MPIQYSVIERTQQRENSGTEAVAYIEEGTGVIRVNKIISK